MTERTAPQGHREICDLLPWYVNGTIADRDRLRVDAHLAHCAGCRSQLAMERTMFEGMSEEPAVEYMPAASLKRLHAALDQLDAGPISLARPAPGPSGARGGGTWRRPTRSWARAAAAAVVTAALVLGLSKISRGPGAERAISEYHTVTASAAHAPDEVIRAVFAPGVTLERLQSILDEAGLRIVAGPTEAGVYALAPTSQRAVGDSLGLLRTHAAVRFAERTDGGSAQPGAAGSPEGRDGGSRRSATP